MLRAAELYSGSPCTDSSGIWGFGCQLRSCVRALSCSYHRSAQRCPDDSWLQNDCHNSTHAHSSEVDKRSPNAREISAPVLRQLAAGVAATVFGASNAKATLLLFVLQPYKHLRSCVRASSCDYRSAISWTLCVVESPSEQPPRHQNPQNPWFQIPAELSLGGLRSYRRMTATLPGAIPSLLRDCSR
jgi:hypothetical protein